MAGEAKIPGRPSWAARRPQTWERSGADIFAADITAVVITRLRADGTKLVVESWTPQRRLQSPGLI